MGKSPKHSHSASAPDLADQAWTRLKAQGFRRTEPREAILRVLTQGHGPFGAEEVARRLGSKAGGGAGIDLVTVYRSLQSFAEAGILRPVDLGDQIVRYELSLDPAHHHHHLTCRSCRKTVPLEECYLDELESRIAREAARQGYRAVDHRLEFTGICADCDDEPARSRV